MSPTQTDEQQRTAPEVEVVEGKLVDGHPTSQLRGPDPLVVEGDGSRPARGQITGNIVGGIIVIIIGFCLAVADLGAHETRMNLRLPALLAALLLVSHGCLMLITATEPKRRDQSARETTAWLLLALGFWLAVATLVIRTTVALTSISYLSAFVLFGLGWVLLVRRPIAR